MESRSPITLRALLAVFAVVLAIVGVNAINPIGAIDPRVPVLGCHGIAETTIEPGEPASDLVSVAVEITYGDRVKCAGGGVGAESIVWPDGTRTDLQGTHRPDVVGDGQIELRNADDMPVAIIDLTVLPDISLECTERDDDLKKIFQLESTDLRSSGWDYVFTDTSTGDIVRPGDPNHPNGGSEEGLERVLLGEAQSTGLCRIVSEAAEAFDGEYQLTIESPWEATQTTPMRIIGPSSKTQWAGTQPAEVTGTVTVNNITASERTNVYQSGCS